MLACATHTDAPGTDTWVDMTRATKNWWRNEEVNTGAKA